MDTNLTSLSIAELRVKCQHKAPEAGRETVVGTTVRFISIYFTALFLRTFITPNQLTFLGVCIFLFGISMFFSADIALQLFGIGLIYFSIIIDACDGEIARLKGNPSGVGSIYTEPLSHDIQYSYMFIPLAVGLYLDGYSVWIFVVGWLGASSKLLQRFLVMRFDKVLAQEQVLASEVDGEGEYKVSFNPNVSFVHKIYRFLNRNLFSSVGFIVPLGICVVIERVDIFVIAWTVFFCIIAPIQFIRQVKYVSALSRKRQEQNSQPL